MGYFELATSTRTAFTDQLDSNKSPNLLTVEQVECIKNHLNMVFKHEIDPSHGEKKHLEELSKIHQGLIGIQETKFNC